MTDQSPPPADDTRRIAELLLLTAYGQTSDPAAQAEILRSLARQAGAADLAEGRDRLRDWLAGLPPADLAGSPDYARYEDIVPQMLAGLLPPDHPDHAWFLAFLARSQWAADQYADLRQALAEEQESRRTAPAPILRPAFGEAVRPLLAVAEPGVAGPDAPDAEAAWRVPIRAARLIVRRRGDRLRQVEVQFARDPSSLDPPAATKELLAGPLPSEPDLDPSQHYTLTVRATRQEAETCTLSVHLAAPAPPGALPVRLRSATGQEWAATTDTHGIAEFAAIPVPALDGLTLLIDLATSEKPE
jgi:hypothetical protein